MVGCMSLALMLGLVFLGLKGDIEEVGFKLLLY